MIQFGFLLAILAAFDIWREQYVVGLFALGGGLLMLSLRKVRLDTRVTLRGLVTPIEDAAETNAWEKLARLLATIAFAGGASVGFAKLLS